MVQVYVVREGEVIMEDDEALDEPILSSWTVNSLGSDGIDIGLEFENPIAVSQEDEPDVMLV